MIDDVKKFLAQPFSADMTAPEWIAFIGFVGSVVIGWNIILAHLFGRI